MLFRSNEWNATCNLIFRALAAHFLPGSSFEFRISWADEWVQLTETRKEYVASRQRKIWATDYCDWNLTLRYVSSEVTPRSICLWSRQGRLYVVFRGITHNLTHRLQGSHSIFFFQRYTCQNTGSANRPRANKDKMVIIAFLSLLLGQRGVLEEERGENKSTQSR